MTGTRRHVRGETSATATRDMRIRNLREQRQKRLHNRIVPRKAIAARPFERRHTHSERHIEPGGVLGRDRVPVRRQPHHLDQRHRRLRGHVL